MGWTTGVRFTAGTGNFLFITTSKFALEPAKSAIKFILEAVSAGVKLTAGHSLLSSAGNKKGI
jgi:hypothetical protein